MYKIFVTLLILGLLEIISISFLTNASQIQTEISKEVELARDWFGDTNTDNIITSSNDAFRKYFKDSGLVAWSYTITQTNDDQLTRAGGWLDRMGHAAFEWVDSRIDTFWDVVYMAVMRAEISTTWIYFSIPVLIPAVIDGIVVREIKKRTYGYTSSVKVQTVVQLLPFVLCIPIIYLLAPMAITPGMMLFWAVSFAIALHIYAANVQKKI